MKLIIKKYSESVKLDYFINILLVMLVIASALPFLMMTSFHDSQRLLSILIINFVIFYQLSTFDSWSRASIIGLLIITLWGTITSTLSVVPAWSFMEVMLWHCIFVAILTIFKETNTKTITIVAITFACTQALYIIRDALNYLFIINDQAILDVWMVIDGFSNIRFYAQFLSWTLPFLIGYLVIAKPLTYRKMLFSVTIASWTLVLMSGTRAFILGVFFSLIATYFITPNIWTRYMKLLLLTGLAGIIGYVMLIFLIPMLLGIDNTAALNSTTNRDFGSSSGRVAIWLDTLQIAINNPIFGIGPMMTALEGMLTYVAHPHNALLQLAAEWGIPFTVIIVLFLGYLTWRWKKLIAHKPEERETLALPITAAISSASAASMVDGLIVMPISLLYMVVITGLGAALWRTWTPMTKRFQAPRVFIITLCIIPAGLTTATAYQWYLINHEEQTHQSGPRFWENGKITAILKNP